MAAIVFMCRTSTPWALLPVGELGCGSVTTCWRRFAEWAEAGVFDRLQELLLDELGAAGLLDWSRASVDSASLRAVRGDLTGANPVDRAKRGCKWHLAVDTTGIVLSLLLGPANRPDQELFASLLDDVPMVATPAGGRRCRPDRCHADKGYDYRHCRGTWPAGASRSASPARASSRPTGWAATAGKQSERSRGCLAAGGCASATSAPRSGSGRSACWPAAGWRSTATPTTSPRGPAISCWPGDHAGRRPATRAGAAGCPVAALERADRGWPRRFSPPSRARRWRGIGQARQAWQPRTAQRRQLRQSRIRTITRTAQPSTSGMSPKRLCSSRLPTARPSRSARTRSQVSTETAMTRCRSAATTGSAVVADRNAIRTSMCRSSPVSPITDGIRSVSRCRPASEVWSLTWRATAASSGWVHAGWSLQRSPASSEASSMKQAPVRGLRCLPGERIGNRSGG